MDHFKILGPCELEHIIFDAYKSIKNWIYFKNHKKKN